MNKIYDKLCLALAVLALLAGLGYYAKQSGALPVAPQASSAASHAPYEVIPVSQSAQVAATWPAATEQAPGELYDVFTPPKIYIDKDGNFQFTPPYDDSKPKPPIGIYLAEIRRDAYRIQLEGYIEEDLDDASKSLLLLFNEETQAQVRARVGDEKSAAEFSLLDFSIERLRDEDNNPYKVAKATLLDQRTGEQVVLTHGERLITDDVTVVLRSDDDPSVNIELKEAPSIFETAAGMFVLEEINLEQSSITVEKIGTDLFDVEVETLYVRAPSAPAPASKVTEATAPEAPAATAFPASEDTTQLFDFAF